MSGILGRIAKSFFVNLLFCGLALLTIFLLVRGADSLSDRIRQSLADASLASLLVRVGDYRAQMLLWCLIIFAISWLTSSLFLASAEQVRPENRQQGGSRLGLWVFMLIATLGLLTITAWFNLFRSGLAGFLSFDAFGSVLVVAVLLNVLAFYLATGLVVKQVMRPSVPFAEGLPKFWS